MIASYHNHSNWSDGRPSLEQIAAAAIEQGIDEIGVSDHFVWHPDGRRPKWAMPPERLDDYLAALRQLRDETAGTTVRIGVEVDWFTEHEAFLRERVADLDVDYLIGSVHEVDGFLVDASPHRWNDIDDAAREAVHRRSWHHVAALARSGLFDIMAHVDLTKKFDFHPRADLTSEIGAALDALADADMVVEINTAGWHKPCADAYPTLDILRGCHERGIAVTLSADAHRTEHLTRDFVRAASRLMSAGHTHVARFKNRERWLEPIEDAITGLVDAPAVGLDDF